MKYNKYKRTTEKDFLGKKVVILKSISNGWGIIPAGTIATIRRKYQGFALETEKCKCCGVAMKINRVDHQYVDLI